MLVRTLRERTVAAIAVVSRFHLFSLAVKIRTQRRTLPLFRNRSVLSATFSGNRSKIYRLDDAIFDAADHGGSLDSYHPKMQTKVIIRLPITC
ncbi:MAG: hypothetical protein K6T94_00810 [Paenibacillus sp.]|nr:hypothetical protein [Paenibacillus sp.]